MENAKFKMNSKEVYYNHEATICVTEGSEWL